MATEGHFNLLGGFMIDSGFLRFMIEEKQRQLLLCDDADKWKLKLAIEQARRLINDRTPSPQLEQ
jgi:hypothetical protein